MQTFLNNILQFRRDLFIVLALEATIILATAILIIK